MIPRPEKKEYIYTDKKLWAVSKILARHFYTGDEPVACACDPIRCLQLGCPLFWDSLFREPRGLKLAISLWMVCEDSR